MVDRLRMYSLKAVGRQDPGSCRHRGGGGGGGGSDLCITLPRKAGHLVRWINSSLIAFTPVLLIIIRKQSIAPKLRLSTSSGLY